MILGRTRETINSTQQASFLLYNQAIVNSSETPETKTLIQKYLQDNYQMVLATSGDHPWAAVLYYSTDKDLNLYFLSDPQTIHCQHIATNSKVAVAISESPQEPNSNKKGLQIFGTAEQISDKAKIVHAINLWKQTLNITSDAYSYAGMMNKLIAGRMYKVTPKKIRFFNEEVWEEGEEPVIEI